MHVQSLQGYFDNGAFFQEGKRVALPERKMAIVNILDIPVNINEVKKDDTEFWEEFDFLAKSSTDENLALSDFPRAYFGRDQIHIKDED